jgi:hypothetical protein
MAGESVTERDSVPNEDGSPSDEPRRDWIGRLLERLSRRAQAGDPDEPRPGMSPLLMVALIALAAAVGLTVGLIITSRGDEAKLEATRMTLELSYPTSGEPSANLEGQPDAAPSNARITCRATSDNHVLGEGRAADDGTFDIPLDATHWPLESLTGTAYPTLNTTLECRAGTGPWVQPLRPPRVAIH